MMYFEYFEEIAEEEMKKLAEENLSQAIAGDKLLKPIHEFLHGKTVQTVMENTPLSSAINLMQEKHIGSILILGRGGVITGIFTERDVLQKVVTKNADLTLPISQFMTPHPVTLKPDDILLNALNQMVIHNHRHVPIVSEQGTPLGILSIRDVAAVILDEFSHIFQERLQRRRDVA